MSTEIFLFPKHQKSLENMAAAAAAAPLTTRRKVQLDEDLANQDFETSEGVEVVPSFDNMGLREDLLRGIYAYGFERPSAIQQRAIKPVVKRRDVIAQAQSGTGTVDWLIDLLDTAYGWLIGCFGLRGTLFSWLIDLIDLTWLWKSEPI